MLMKTANQAVNTQLIPRRIFFTKGVGWHRDQLQSYELALRKAGIAQLNLVKVSSIFPPDCKIIPRSRGLRMLKPGQIAYCVMSRNETNEPNRLISASIGLAVPARNGQYGYLSEHHGYGETQKHSGEYSEDLAATMLASTLGIEFDPDRNYDERKEVYRMSGQIVTSRNITQSAEGDRQGLWTTVLAAAVFVT